MVLRTHACVDRGTQVPPLDDESALISMKYGWRLTRRAVATREASASSESVATSKEGGAVLEWRCPGCYARFKQERLQEPHAEGWKEPREA